MGLIRPLVYLTLGFVVGNLYRGCAHESRQAPPPKMRTALEYRLEPEKLSVQHPKNDYTAITRCLFEP